MLIKNIVLSAVIGLASSGVFAFGDGERLSAEDRWNSMPDEKQIRISERATALGFDVTTEEGRLAFRESMKEQRVAHAAELGFDISTAEGRQQFRLARQENRGAVREQIRALPEEDRLALKEELKDLSRKERREILTARFGGN